jgi:hypothetical protein
MSTEEIIFWGFVVPKYNKDKSSYGITSFRLKQWSVACCYNNNTNEIHISYFESIWNLFSKIRTALWINNSNCQENRNPKKVLIENQQPPSRIDSGSQFIFNTIGRNHVIWPTIIWTCQVLLCSLTWLREIHWYD